jgi:hypothetical protein
LKAVYGSKFNQSPISIDFRSCIAGEAKTSSSCELCPIGRYSLLENATECFVCPPNVQCLGGKEFSLDSGYWRISNESSRIYECLSLDACGGGFNNSKQFPVNCAPGYDGYLCQACAPFGDKRYERAGSNGCSECLPLIVNLARLVAFVIIIIIYLAILIGVNLRKTAKGNSEAIFRIMTNYCQIITSVLSFNLKYPKFMLASFTPVTATSEFSSSLISFDCLMTGSSGAFV